MSMMKSVLVFLSSSILIRVSVGWGDTALPDGYLLGLKVVQIERPWEQKCCDYASLFKIEFSGEVSQLWNYSYNATDVIQAANTIAADIGNQLVYLPTFMHFTALDMNTGEVKTQVPVSPPNMFISYDYLDEAQGLCGICAGNQNYSWCSERKNGSDRASLEYHYSMPYVKLSPDGIINIDIISYLDRQDQTIWYMQSPGNNEHYVMGVDYTTGKVVFTSSKSSNDGLFSYCIAHDYSANRVFAYAETYSLSSKKALAGLAEVLPHPGQSKMLLEVPGIEDLSASSFNSCDYDQKTHTLMVLMSNQSIHYFHAMPSNLLLMDTVSLTYKIIPLPLFRERWDSDSTVTALRFIPNT